MWPNLSYSVVCLAEIENCLGRATLAITFRKACLGHQIRKKVRHMSRLVSSLRIMSHVKYTFTSVGTTTSCKEYFYGGFSNKEWSCHILCLTADKYCRAPLELKCKDIPCVPCVIHTIAGPKLDLFFYAFV